MTQNNNHFDFANVPEWYVVCTNNNCPLREGCMRFLAGSNMPERMEAARCVMPWALKDGKCRWLDTIKVVRCAAGFSHLFDQVMKKDYTTLREKITKYLRGPKAYYEYKRGERLLTPEQQQRIKELVKDMGYTWDVPFDGVVETYVYGEAPSSAQFFYL